MLYVVRYVDQVCLIGDFKKLTFGRSEYHVPFWPIILGCLSQLATGGERLGEEGINLGINCPGPWPHHIDPHYVDTMKVERSA